MAADIESALLARLGQDGEIADSGKFAEELGKDHQDEVVGVIKSLWATEYVGMEVSGAMEWHGVACAMRRRACAT